MCAHRKYCVEQKNALLRPFRQISVVRNIASAVLMQLLINIYERRRYLDIWLYGKAKTVRLPVSVVRILSEDHHFYIFQRRKSKCIKNVVGRRIDHSCPVFFVHCLIQFRIIWLSEFRLQRSKPVIGNRRHTDPSFVFLLPAYRRTDSPRSFRYLFTSLISSSL